MAPDDPNVDSGTVVLVNVWGHGHHESIRFKPVYGEVSTGLAKLHGREEKQSINVTIQAQRIKNSKLGRKTCWRRTSSHSISACNRQVKVRCHPYKSHRPIKNTSKKI
eukprot:g56132.t1